MQYVLPDRAVPQTYKTGIPTIIVGVDPRTGASFTDHSAEVYSGWCNASKGMDAWGALNASFGNLWKATAEINESLYPHVQWSRDYRTDGGGPGEWRGICGSHYEKEVCVDAKVYTYVVGMKYPMPGICGGTDGSPNEMIIRYGSDDEFQVKHTADWVPIHAGERIMFDYGGGGGWGDPLVRDPQAVLDDVIDEYVSVEGASRDYGVVLAGFARRAHARDRRGRHTPRGGVSRCGPNGPDMGFRVGVDVGGTFTDLICVTPSGEIVLDKTPTTLDDQSTGVMNGLEQLAERFGIELDAFCRDLDILVHGTTTADNTMIEMNGAPTGLLVTEGHRDEIELRRCHKEEIWDPELSGPDPDRAPAGAHPDPRAHELRRQRAPRARRGRGAPRRAAPEEARRAFDRGDVPLLVRESRARAAHARDRAGRVPRRRAHLALARGHAARSRVRAGLDDAGQRVRRAAHRHVHAEPAGQAAPGRVSRPAPDHAVDRRRHAPRLRLAPRGHAARERPDRRRHGRDRRGPQPPASATSSRSTWAAPASTSASCATGGPRSRPTGTGATATTSGCRWSTCRASARAAVRSPGCARARCSSVPESAGSSPGPACYGRGGTRPSVTDADAVLGYLPVDGFAGGRMHLDVAAARTAITQHVAEPLGIDVTDAAWGIERIVNSNMANATRKVLAGHGADPRDLSLIAFGGNGAVHAAAIARELGVDRIIVPKAAPAFSALGVLVADYVVDLVRSYVTPLSQVDLGRVRDLLTDLLQEVDKELDPTGVAAADVERDLFAQMCYPGQNFDMSVPVPEGVTLDEPGLLDLAERFHDQHEAERGFCFRSQQPLMRGVRVIARGTTPKPDHLAETGTLADADAGAPRRLAPRTGATVSSTRRCTTAPGSARARPSPVRP